MGGNGNWKKNENGKVRIYDKKDAKAALRTSSPCSGEEALRIMGSRGDSRFCYHAVPPILAKFSTIAGSQ